MAHDRCNCYFSFWAIFCPFTPAWKMEISKEWKKKPGDIIILHKCTKTHDHMLYCSWDMTCDGCNSYFSFWAFFFCSFTPITAQKIKISKKWKKHLVEISSLYQKLWLDNVRFLRYGAQQMDRQTDGQKKWHREVGAPPKNVYFKKWYIINLLFFKNRSNINIVII